MIHVCMDSRTLRRYNVIKRYAADGMFTEWPTGARYNLVKVYV